MMKRPYSPEQVECILEEALDRGKCFTEPFQSLVRKTEPNSLMLLNAMDKQPFPHTDAESPVIFIGDANHAVSPFAGNGANMALMDGWELASQLSKPQSMSAAVSAYDKLSMPRSQSALAVSHWSISMAHATGWKLFLYKLFMKLIAVVRHLSS
jgi:2-polyprenyl-6-methoxyphenol hydroxylase-like FAD-dependent oxidoreductase